MLLIRRLMQMINWFLLLINRKSHRIPERVKKIPVGDKERRERYTVQCEVDRAGVFTYTRHVRLAQAPRPTCSRGHPLVHNPMPFNTCDLGGPGCKRSGTSRHFYIFCYLFAFTDNSWNSVLVNRRKIIGNHGKGRGHLSRIFLSLFGLVLW